MATTFCSECHKQVATVIKTGDKVVVMQQGRPAFTTKPGSRISIGGCPPGFMPVKCPDGHSNLIDLGGEAMGSEEQISSMADKKAEMEAKMKASHREMILKQIASFEKIRDDTLARAKEMDERINKLKAEIDER